MVHDHRAREADGLVSAIPLFQTRSHPTAPTNRHGVFNDEHNRLNRWRKRQFGILLLEVPAVDVTNHVVAFGVAGAPILPRGQEVTNALISDARGVAAQRRQLTEGIGHADRLVLAIAD